MRFLKIEDLYAISLIIIFLTISWKNKIENTIETTIISNQDNSLIPFESNGTVEDAMYSYDTKDQDDASKTAHKHKK